MAHTESQHAGGWGERILSLSPTWAAEEDPISKIRWEIFRVGAHILWKALWYSWMLKATVWSTYSHSCGFPFTSPKRPSSPPDQSDWIRGVTWTKNENLEFRYSDFGGIPCTPEVLHENRLLMVPVILNNHSVAVEMMGFHALGTFLSVRSSHPALHTKCRQNRHWGTWKWNSDSVTDWSQGPAPGQGNCFPSILCL